MGDMFANFDNQNEYYVPNNVSTQIKQQIKVEHTNEIFNIKGDFVGYKIHNQCKEILNIKINPTIIVEKDALILDQPGEYPTVETPGYVGKKAYNIVDNKSFICKSTNQIWNEWFEQKYFEYPTSLTRDKGKEIIFKKYKNICDKQILIEVRNYKYDIEKEIIINGDDVINVSFDDDLIKGSYYCFVYLIDNQNEVENEIFDKTKISSFQLVIE